MPRTGSHDPVHLSAGTLKLAQRRRQGRNIDTEWIELWVDHCDGAAPSPVRAGYSPGTTVSELSRALSNRSALPGGSGVALVGVDPPTGPISGEAAVERSGLQRGQVVRLTDSGRLPTTPGTLRTTVLVRRGPDRGRRVDLGASLVVGRAEDCDLRLLDPALSRRHVRFTRRHALVEVEALGSAAVGVEGRKLSSSQPVEPGTPIRVGDSELVVMAPTLPPSAASPPTATPQTVHQRPPRAPWAANPPVVSIPEPPRRTGVGTVPWLSIGLTGAFAIVMAMGGGFGGGISGNLIWFFTPLLLASGAIEYALSARRGGRKARTRWRADLAGRCAELDGRLNAEARRETHAAPPPSEWLLAAQVGSARLWERRREHDDALRLRLGLCHAYAPLAGQLPSTGPTELLTEASEAVDRIRWRQDVVSALDLGDVGSVGVHGPDAHDLAASLVAQLVAAVGPEDVAVAVAVQESRAVEWRWISAVPHVRSAAELLDSPATAGADGHARLVAAVNELGASRRRASAGTQGRPEGDVPLVVILDGELGATIEMRRLAALCQLTEVGVHVLWLERQPSHTPLGCGATITTARKGLATAVPRPGAAPHQVRWEGLTPQRLEALGRHLAPRIDGDRAGTGAGLPAAVSLASLPVPTHGAGSLAATVGVGPGGPVTIDLRRDGPHALVAGTTGAGKSELLRTLVAALAMAHSPERLNFVLVDFKGGTGMGPLSKLPHVAGMITDLDLGEAQRLRLGLEAEVERRLRILSSTGVENLAALERLHPEDAPPAIVVVIDEFAALARQAPAVLDGLVDLAQRGRSLGIHLVLATQRPRGVISDAIRANTNLRLVARMADAEESTDVLDDPSAANLAVGAPGRVLMRVGAAAPSPLQVAFTGTPVGARPPVTVLPLALDPPPVVVLQTASTTTEADAVVRSTLEAARSRGAARLWLEPLPGLLSDPTAALGSGQRALSVPCRPQLGLGARAGATTPRVETGAVLRRWPLAMADLPRRRDRAVWSLAPAGGVLVVLGGGGSGRTSLLRAVGLTAAEGGAAVAGIDGAGGHLTTLDGASDGSAAIGAIVPVRDDERLARLIWWLEQRDGSTPCALLIDGWEGVWDRAEQAGGSAWLARLVELIRTARAGALTVALSANRIGALPPEVRAARSELLALSGAQVDPDLGLHRPPPADAPPGRARLVTAQPHLRGGEADPTEGPMVQVRWAPPLPSATNRPSEAPRRRTAGAAPLLLTHPPRIRCGRPSERQPGWASDTHAASGYPSSESRGGNLGVRLGIDLERDLPADAPAHGPFWVLGRPRSGRSTTLAALATHSASISAGSRVLLSPDRSAPAAQHLWSTTLSSPPDTEAIGHNLSSVTLVAVDDAHRLDDDGWAALARWLEALRVGGSTPLLALAADPATLDRWNPVVTSLLGHGSGLVLSPEPDEDGRLLGGDLPRHRPFVMSAGRGYLISRGVGARPVQVAWPHA